MTLSILTSGVIFDNKNLSISSVVKWFGDIGYWKHTRYKIGDGFRF